MARSLFSRCLGCNATLFAKARRPDAFADVRCLVGVQPLSPDFCLEKKVTVPTLLYQVRDDSSTIPDDVQRIFNAMPARDKHLIWVLGTTRRWNCYTHFQNEPERALNWFAKHMA